MGYSCLEGRLTLSLICAPSAGARYGSPYILHALWMAVDGREPSPSHHPPLTLLYKLAPAGSHPPASPQRPSSPCPWTYSQERGRVGMEVAIIPG